jgi:hypothetical protein
MRKKNRGWWGNAWRFEGLGTRGQGPDGTLKNEHLVWSLAPGYWSLKTPPQPTPTSNQTLKYTLGDFESIPDLLRGR